MVVRECNEDKDVAVSTLNVTVKLTTFWPQSRDLMMSYSSMSATPHNTDEETTARTFRRVRKIPLLHGYRFIGHGSVGDMKTSQCPIVSQNCYDANVEEMSSKADDLWTVSAALTIRLWDSSIRCATIVQNNLQCITISLLESEIDASSDKVSIMVGYIDMYSKIWYPSDDRDRSGMTIPKLNV
ncbi:hypothetical protein T4B_8968 [Trichinella pseudospiralis]|uniref:Uncharacterized protein n=1 Tax=Trichinella pseudospiralis TaxID=6337 RepID=A0A0V1JD31_TRIPS|nr:hypothetical protein T4A_2752 [Trichinella pseudospiralis]KRZ32883.1 hypothetical protein T4B_8968 [Trichinella pseudospiralis]KRZ46114.1 hypothetical protein T4C_11052 [Trichinella pseudospiralis]